MREENLVNMQPQNKPPSGFKPTRSGAPCHLPLSRSCSSSKVTIFHLPWIKSPRMAKFKCWSLQRIFKKLAFFSPIHFPSSQDAFPSQKPCLAPGKACHWFSQKYDQISQYSPSSWVCNRVQMRGASREPEDIGLGTEMSQRSMSRYSLFHFIAYSSSSFSRENGKINRSVQGGPSPFQWLSPSDSWHLFWHCPTLSPVQGQSSKERSTAYMMMIKQRATRTSLSHLQPSCCQGPSFWVGSSPVSKYHGRALVPGSHDLPPASPCLLIFHFDSLLPVIPVINNKRCWGTFHKCVCLIILISERSCVDKKSSYLLFSAAVWTLQGCTGWLQPHKAAAAVHTPSCKKTKKNLKKEKSPSSLHCLDLNSSTASGSGESHHYCRLQITFPHFDVALLGSSLREKNTTSLPGYFGTCHCKSTLSGMCASPHPTVKGHPSPCHWFLSCTTNCTYNRKAQAEFPWESEMTFLRIWQ